MTHRKIITIDGGRAQYWRDRKKGFRLIRQAEEAIERLKGEPMYIAGKWDEEYSDYEPVEYPAPFDRVASCWSARRWRTADSSHSLAASNPQFVSTEGMTHDGSPCAPRIRFRRPERNDAATRQPSMKVEMDALEDRKKELAELLTDVPEDTPDLLPSASAIYTRKVAT